MARGIAENSGDVEVAVVSQSEFGVFTHHAPWMLKHFDGISQCSWMESGTGFDNGCKTTWLASHGFEYEHGDNSLAGRIATPIRNRKAAEQRLPQFDRVLCVSDRIYQTAKDMCPAVRVVPGVNQDLFLPWELPNRDKLTIGWCGQRDGLTKGYREILEPLKELLGESVEWQINTRSAQDPLDDMEMLRWYHGIDLFVSTSCSEGFQMPVLEAASCGRPVIATDVGAAREVVQHGENGFIVRTYECASHFEGVVCEIAGHIREYDAYREMLIEHGRRAAGVVTENFRWEERTGEWIREMLP
jgi:hypothetical protein